VGPLRSATATAGAAPGLGTIATDGSGGIASPPRPSPGGGAVPGLNSGTGIQQDKVSVHKTTAQPGRSPPPVTVEPIAATRMSASQKPLGENASSRTSLPPGRS
jgi:hypothetical protein